jgi:hypothetical protein
LTLCRTDDAALPHKRDDAVQRAVPGAGGAARVVPAAGGGLRRDGDHARGGVPLLRQGPRAGPGRHQLRLSQPHNYLHAVSSHQPALGPRGGLWPVLLMCNP